MTPPTATYPSLLLLLLLLLLALPLFFLCSSPDPQPATNPTAVVNAAAAGKFFPSERDALIVLRDSLTSSADLHYNWTGAPCYRHRSRWLGILCADSHVVGIVLESIHFAGILPAGAFRNLTRLSTLILHENDLYGGLPDLGGLAHLQEAVLSRNRFAGTIPEVLVSLPGLSRLELQENLLRGKIPPFDQKTLVVFNASFNFLDGRIPQTPVLQRFTIASFDHNPGLCGKPTKTPCMPAPAVAEEASPSYGRFGLALTWISVGLSAIIFLIALASLFFLCFSKIRSAVVNRGRGDSGEPRRVRTELEASGLAEEPTLRFFGDGEAPFSSEDLERSEPLAIGTGPNGRTYSVRLPSGMVVAVKRMREVGELSTDDVQSQRVPHGNLKSWNVVVNINLRNRFDCFDCKLVHFGLLPVTGPEHGRHLAIRCSPEFRQMDWPEMGRKMDVYCFGLLIVELVTGEEPVDAGDVLVNLARRLRGEVWVLDVNLARERESHGDIFRLLNIGLECLSPEPARRPEMSEVVPRIEALNGGEFAG
ncbi:Inactive leucine-rich repeat receptor-like serine/threonine-protein kinase [Apostasia shenzhenica]|uniref:Inactive leucine-rich repeat receptor-like serine/threonine-protein kinase n=1 Tax=Apostasia shenzhenica TaxID=1088818 RepID=A0A2I0AVR1_9ASPA|nr:Inactive leucine-rich repeat receptor-like serine/threonine-protein kinase [Apostasia shenzhenica]